MRCVCGGCVVGVRLRYGRSLVLEVLWIMGLKHPVAPLQRHPPCAAEPCCLM